MLVNTGFYNCTMNYNFSIIEQAQTFTNDDWYIEFGLALVSLIEGSYSNLLIFHKIKLYLNSSIMEVTYLEVSSALTL